MSARRILSLLACLAVGCDFGPKPILPVEQAGELIVLTTNGPATYFEDADGHASGFEHDLAALFAKDLGVSARFLLADDTTKLEAALRRNQAHVGAAGLVRHLDLPGGLAWGPPYFTTQLQVVYRSGERKPANLGDLVGGKVGAVDVSYVDTHLAEPPKLPVPFERMPPGTPVADLLTLVATGKLDFALVESTRFTLLRKHFPQLEVAFNVGGPVQYAWTFAPLDKKRLMPAAEAFFARITKDGTLKRLVDRHYAHAARISAIDSGALLERIGTMLPELKPHFLEAEAHSNIDWRLIAAIGYQESHWEPKATSPTGVRGLMMLTEETATRMKVKDRLDARESILGGARYLAMLKKDSVPERIPEPDRTFLALAAYNLGTGHMEDARILAQRSGLNPDLWQDVKQVIRKLADPSVYHSLKHGFARGHEALQFVDNVRNYADILARIEPRETALQVPAGSSALRPPK